MCKHQDHSVRPRQRAENNRIIAVSPEDHATAYLQHHVHAKAIIKCLLDDIPISFPSKEREFIVHVFTRFDGPEFIQEVPLRICVDVDAPITLPPVDIYLYIVTGQDTTGVHYNPMFKNMRLPRQGAAQEQRKPGVPKQQKH